MKAVLLTKPCSACEMTISDVAMPTVRPGWVLVRIKAFGINHSEILLRQFEIANSYIAKPVIPGIECVGTVVDPSDTPFRKGDKVMALMGGMGRSFNGSYAEYALLPADHVFAIDSKLDWDELAAIPETYYTAFGSLTISLQLSANDRLLIRGGTSTVGLAALQLAKAMGAEVIATTRSEHKAGLLRQYGADSVILEGDDFLKRFLELYPAGATKVLELIGAATLRESLRITARHGIVCHTGLLGGIFTIKDFDPIKEIPSGVYLTGFYSNRPSRQQIDALMTLIGQYDIHPIIARRLTFDKIAEAHALAEQRSSIGKIVVTIQTPIHYTQYF